jgi:hypothetical protein
VANKKSKKNSGPGNPARRAAQREADSRLSPGDQRTLSEFTAWAAEQEQISAPNPEFEAQGLNGLMASVRAVGTNPALPSSVPTLLQVAFGKVEAAEAETQGLGSQVAEACFGVLGDYLRFREQTDTDPAPWQKAREDAQAAIDEHFDLSALPVGFDQEGSLLEQHLNGAAGRAMDEVDAVALRSAYLALPAIAGIPSVLEWIGEGRGTDRAGEPSEADRGSVWGFMGRTGEPDPTLLSAWWDNLVTSEVIDVAAGRVTPGHGSAGWGSPTGPDQDEVAEVTQGLFAEVVSRVVEEHGRTEAVEILGWALSRDLPSDVLDASTARSNADQALQDLDEKAATAIERGFAAVADFGFVHGSLDAPRVARPLRAVVAHGLRLALLYTQLDEDDLFRDETEA